MSNVYAFTDNYSAGYPGYINISTTPDGCFRVIVRGQGQHVGATITLTQDQVDEVIDELLNARKAQDASEWEGEMDMCRCGTQGCAFHEEDERDVA